MAPTTPQYRLAPASEPALPAARCHPAMRRPLPPSLLLAALCSPAAIAQELPQADWAFQPLRVVEPAPVAPADWTLEAVRQAYRPAWERWQHAQPALSFGAMAPEGVVPPAIAWPWLQAHWPQAAPGQEVVS